VKEMIADDAEVKGRITRTRTSKSSTYLRLGDRLFGSAAPMNVAPVIYAAPNMVDESKRRI